MPFPGGGGGSGSLAPVGRGSPEDAREGSGMPRGCAALPLGWSACA